MAKQFNYSKFCLIFILIIILGCAPLRPPKKGIYHKVKKGETIWSIAKLYKVSPQDIVRANDYNKIKKLKPGTIIFIPSGTKKIRKKIYPEKITPKLSFIFPVKGKIISHFGLRNGRRHQGIDIKAPLGSKIRAIYDGVVTYSDNKMRGYGKVIIIKHKEGFYSVYAHNKKNLVRKGQRVRKGEIIALLGDSGRATTPHLHFEIRYKGKSLDPLIFFSKYR